MSKVVIMSERIGFREVALKEELIKIDLEVSAITFKLSAIHDEICEADLSILFVTESITDYYKELVYLKDQLIELNCPLYVIGDTSYLESILSVALIKKKYVYQFDKERLLKDIRDAVSVREARQYRILVIDDSGVTLRNVKNVLDDKYDVQIANSAVNGIKCMSIKKPDLILLDYDMPVCNGKQALEMIQQDPAFASIPVFFLTGRSDRNTVLAVMSLHPKGYILKTSGADELVRVVDNFFAQLKGELLN